MNINSVYKCTIYQLIDNYPYDSRLSEDQYFVEHKYKIVKEVLVYRDKKNNFMDLETKEKYRVGYDNCNIGDFFINAKKIMIPLSSIVDYKIKNMSKQKILKKYNEQKKREFFNEY